MSNSYNGNRDSMSWRPGSLDLTKSDPTKLMGESGDLVAWSMAQGLAMSKIKIFSAMAKSINDQQ